MADYSIDDRFETVAITWSQPEAAVMLSMFEAYEIPALPVGQQVMRLWPTSGVALQGIHIRVHNEWRDEALELLAEVAQRPAAIRPFPTENRWAYGIVITILCAIGLVPVPPTRTPSTFFLGSRALRDTDVPVRS